MADFASARAAMVDRQLRTNDVTDLRIQAAVAAVPRERFVPAERRALAYMSDCVPLGGGRHLMDPRSFGKLLQLAAIAPDDVVLVVGGGTGYAAAVAAALAGAVVMLESDPELAAIAEQVLGELCIDTAAVVRGALADGYAAQGPYDVIFIDGGVEEIPPALFAQLKEGGRLVAIRRQGPVGKAHLFVKSGSGLSQRVAFDATVPVLPGFARAAGFVF